MVILPPLKYVITGKGRKAAYPVILRGRKEGLMVVHYATESV